MTADRQRPDLFPGLDGLARGLDLGDAIDARRPARRLNWRGGCSTHATGWVSGCVTLEQPFETVLGLPRLADVPDLDRKLLSLLQCWAGVAQRSTEYSAIVAQVWMSAYADFLPALQAAAGEGKPATGGRELLDQLDRDRE